LRSLPNPGNRKNTLNSSSLCTRYRRHIVLAGTRGLILQHLVFFMAASKITLALMLMTAQVGGLGIVAAQQPNYPQQPQPLPYVQPAGGVNANYGGAVEQTGWNDAFRADKKMGGGSKSIAKPSQKAAPDATVNTPRSAPNAQTSQGTYTPPASASGPVTNPNMIVQQDVPLIPRKAAVPYQAPAATATANTTVSPETSSRRPFDTPASAPPVSSRVEATPSPSLPQRSLQERLAAARRGLQTPAPTVVTPEENAATTGINIEGPTPSIAKPQIETVNPREETSNFSPRFNPNNASNTAKSAEIVNPLAAGGSTTARRPFDDDGSLPSVLNSGAPGSGPSPTVAGETSSRRGFTMSGPVERVASRETGDRVPPAEPTLAGPELAVPTKTTPLIATRQSPQISVETSGPRTITVGKEANYEILLKNTGDLAASDVSVTVRIPDFAELTGSKATSGTSENGTPTENPTASGSYTVEWRVPRVEAHARETLSLRIIPRKSLPFELGVAWQVSPVSSQTIVEVQEPKLALSLAGATEVLYGSTKVYKLSLSNPGTGDAENVMLHLSPLSDPNAAMTKHHIGTIPAGDSKVIEVEMTARQAGKLVIRAQAKADNGLTAEISEEITVRRAALAVNVDGSKSKYTGTTAAYTIHVSNTGDAPAEAVQIAAQIPTGAKFISATNGQFSADSGKVVWTVPAIRAGGEIELECKCLLMSPGVNQVSVTATANTDLSATAAAQTQVEALADLKLVVNEPRGPLPLGEEVVYEIMIKNHGSKSAERVYVVAFFEEGIDPTSATGTASEIGSGDVRFAPVATLAPGSTATFKIKAMPKQAGNLAFRAEAVCEADGSKQAQQCTVLYYGEEGINQPKEVAGPEDDISAAAGQPNRNAGTSSRKPTVQAAPSAAPTGGIPLGGPAVTAPASPVPQTATKPTVVPAYGMPAAGPAIGTPVPMVAQPMGNTNPTPAVTGPAIPLGGPTVTPAATPNTPAALPTYSLPAAPAGGATLLLPSK
jgi:uncharacterized repeat protein (TIGR01451 family)